ncbi:winged helix-turn-helix transcriptional regulator [Pseudonocardia alni]|uniref:HxlR family transcriptional regulator n=1 Tax=Pseudonocardia alni TaxID=33907 RepID=A0AA44ZNE1_PSEA5|nr:helix-turn-helix domain-containing protein [Pseudonocardia alni]PKB29679.1 HxlR family transcriptional regulator [Pseudonocardia alni]
MLGHDHEDQVCSVARALEAVGQRWSLLIMRDLFVGVRRFDALVESLGVTRSVLTRRLAHLEEHRIIERVVYQHSPLRFEYRPTAKGQGLLPVLAGLMQWGDRHYPHPAGPPRVLLHGDCGGEVDATSVRCVACGERPEFEEVHALPGPALADPSAGHRPDVL